MLTTNAFLNKTQRLRIALGQRVIAVHHAGELVQSHSIERVLQQQQRGCNRVSVTTRRWIKYTNDEFGALMAQVDFG